MQLLHKGSRKVDQANCMCNSSVDDFDSAASCEPGQLFYLKWEAGVLLHRAVISRGGEEKSRNQLAQHIV